jgi:hypothetical protein
MWRGLGINLNFTASGVDIPTQLAEIKTAGFTRVRLNIVDYNNSVGIALWKPYVRCALKLGFTKVIWGIGAGATHITAANYSNFDTALQTLATWFQAQNNPRLELQMGNEEDLHIDSGLTAAQLRSKLRDTATTLQQVYTAGPISYVSSIFVGNEIAAWTSEGIGNMDRIGFNLYGSDAVFNRSAIAVAALPRAYVGEWGTNNGYADFGNEDLYRQAIHLRQQMLINAGVTEAYFYNYMEANRKWGIKNYPITGDFRTAWPVLLGVRAWFIGNPNIAISRGNTPTRGKTPVRQRDL